MARVIIKDKFNNQLEQHTIHDSLHGWMRRVVPNFIDACCPPYSATLNNRPWPFIKHDEALSDNDVIELTIEPRDPATIFYVVAFIAAGYAYYTASNIPNNYQNSTPDGNSIYSPNGKANTARPNGIIREVAGDVQIFPDLICPPRRRYLDNVEYLYLNLCVGAGEFDLDVSKLYISETPMAKYAGDIVMQISGPGQDISGHEAHENWFSSEEVANLKLTTEIDENEEPVTWTMDASGDQITVYANGLPAPFPYELNTVFLIQSGVNGGYYRVANITGENSNVVTVVRQALSTINDRTGTISGLEQFYDNPPTNLVTETGVDLNWSALATQVNWEGPFEILPVGESTQFVELDFNFPRGLAILEDNGDLTSHSVHIEVQYREVGETVWQTKNQVYANNTLDELGFTMYIDLGRAYRPEIRVRRVTPETDDTKYSEDVHLVRVKGLLESPHHYDNVTTLQLRLRGTNALAQTAENKVNIRGAKRLLPTLAELKASVESDTPYTLTAGHATSSIMRYLAHAMTQTTNENLINWDELASLDTLLEARNDELNVEFSDETTLWEAVKIIVSPGYCEPTIKEGLLTPVRIAKTTDYRFLYTPDVMLNQGLKQTNRHYESTESKGIIVEYLNPQTGINETVNCFLANDSEAHATRVQAKGITNRTAAWRFGMRERRRQALKPATYTFETEMDALNSDYGNPDAIASPMKANQCLSIIDVQSDIVSLDGDVMLSTTDNNFAVFRKPTGECSGLYFIEAGAQSNEIKLLSPSSLDFIPQFDGAMEPTQCVIGLESDIIQRVWIRGINPSGTDTVSVTAEEYIDAIFDDDENQPPT